MQKLSCTDIFILTGLPRTVESCCCMEKEEVKLVECMSICTANWLTTQLPNLIANRRAGMP